MDVIVFALGFPLSLALSVSVVPSCFLTRAQRNSKSPARHSTSSLLVASCAGWFVPLPISVSSLGPCHSRSQIPCRGPERVCSWFPSLSCSLCLGHPLLLPRSRAKSSMNNRHGLQPPHNSRHHAQVCPSVLLPLSLPRVLAVLLFRPVPSSFVCARVW